MYEKKYKIVCLIHSLGHKGGMQRVAVNLANNWAANGHTVEIWTLRNSKPFYKLNNSIAVVHLTGKEINGVNRIKKVIASFFELSKGIVLLNKLFSQRKPNIVVIHRGGVSDSFVGFQRFYRNRTLELLHMQFIQEPGAFPKYIEFIQSIVFRLFQPKENLVVLNSATQQMALAAGWKNVVKIPNAVPFLSVAKSNCQNPYLLAVARDDPKKGLDILIRAFSIVSNKNKNWKLRIIGEGITSSSNNVNKLISELQLENQVVLLEPVSNIQEYYLDSSIYVLSSYTEGMPMVVLEAMECGLPIISSDLEGIDDVISPKCSLKFQTGNFEQLAKQINRLIEDSEMRILMGKESTQHVKQFYPENINSLWYELFDKTDSNN